MIKHNFRLPKIGSSNPISAILRPYFEAKRAKTAFGALLSTASLVLAFGFYPTINLAPVSALEPAQTAVEIETALAGPAKLLPQMKTISQGYWAIHPGIDITAPKGSPIYPIKAGKVMEISTSRYNYGRSVLVEHDDGLTSLYAHMGKIMVQEGDKIDEKTELGEVGITGRTSGPHLHLEVRKNGVSRNPIAYL